MAQRASSYSRHAMLSFCVSLPSLRFHFSPRQRVFCTTPPIHRTSLSFSYYKNSPKRGSNHARPEKIIVPLENVLALEKKLLTRFSNRDLLIEAMLHESTDYPPIDIYLKDGENLRDISHIRCNNRLEWVGDRIFGAQTAAWLYANHPDEGAGTLTKRYSTVVSRQTMNMLCISLGLQDGLIRSTYHHPHPDKTVISNSYGNYFEALFGALHLSDGEEAVSRFFDHSVKQFLDSSVARNYKGLLLETLSQLEVDLVAAGKVDFRSVDVSRKRGEGKYDLIDFEVGIYIYDTLVALGVGSNKRRAASDVSQNLLKRLDSESLPALVKRCRKQRGGTA